MPVKHWFGKAKADLIVPPPAPPITMLAYFGVPNNSGLGPEILPVNYGYLWPTLKLGARGAQGRFCDLKTTAGSC